MKKIKISKLNNDITFIIVTFNSNNIICKCLNSLPKKSKKILIENSNRFKQLKKITKKFTNIKIINSKLNNGYGAGNNIGLKYTKTKYAFIISPDVIFKKRSFFEIKKAIVDLNDRFTILAPNINMNYANPNKKLTNVKSVLGCAMLLNLKNGYQNLLFDENIFLFMEEIDLCDRILNKSGKIYIVNNSHVYHYGKRSVAYSLKVEALRNWHFMWSFFYYHKKKKNYFYALVKSIKYLIRFSFELFLSIIIINDKKFLLSKYRVLGLWNSLLNKKSFLRLKDI